MKLIGMLDSPYVRRVAISLQYLGLAFEHEAISVFRGIDRFRTVNPVVKAPTLVCDDGETLMDSTLILEYGEALAAPRTLMPSALAARQRALHLIGLALAGCEKSVQVVYERELRPPERRHAPWVERVTGQAKAAFAALEAELAARPRSAAPGVPIDQAGITIAVAWHFNRQLAAETFDEAAHPHLAAFSREAETRAEFAAAPHGDGVYRAAR